MDRDNRSTGKGSSRLHTSPVSGLSGRVRAERQGLVDSWVLAEGQGWGQPGHAHPVTSPTACESSRSTEPSCLVQTSSQDLSSTRPERGWLGMCHQLRTHFPCDKNLHPRSCAAEYTLPPPAPCHDVLASTGPTCAVPLSSTTKAHVPSPLPTSPQAPRATWDSPLRPHVTCLPPFQHCPHCPTQGPCLGLYFRSLYLLSNQ